MKDSEFLELLNLYLDHEISAADAARLEAEVQANPKRRSVYRDYCRMQKACTMLAKDFADQPAERKVVDFEPSRSAWSSGWVAVGGLAAAAACVALVLVNRTSDAPVINGAGAAPSEIAKSETAAPIAPVAKAPEAVAQVSTPRETPAEISRTVAPAPVAAPQSESRALFTALPLTLGRTNPTSAEALLAVAQQNARAQFEWMQSVQLAPIQPLTIDNMQLDARVQPAPRSTTNAHPPAQGTVEWAAFKFQR